MPRRRLDFNLETPDGKVALVYKAGPSSRLDASSVVLGSAIVPALLAPYLVPPELLFYSYSALFLPSIYALMRRGRNKRQARGDVEEMHLFENGEQLLVRTADGVLHKLDILHTESHHLEDGKNGSLAFVMENSGRPYRIETKGALAVDFPLLDKLAKAICVDTKRSQTLYHRLVSRQ